MRDVISHLRSLKKKKKVIKQHNYIKVRAWGLSSLIWASCPAFLGLAFSGGQATFKLPFTKVPARALRSAQPARSDTRTFHLLPGETDFPGSAFCASDAESLPPHSQGFQ